ncbi:LMBR1-like_membrane protein [Hexamita inflata]|uniref:LMBR1-like membrane protein n=1 Tax=Hexamita inflata TaxID=28002 RepID=A0AA86TZG6_9EUKA|nr:LMBR1-like membrane protein [Hexamita inflata]
MTNQIIQLKAVTIASILCQIIYSIWFLSDTTQRKRAQDMDKNHRFKPSYHLHLTVPTLVTVVIAFAYAIFTFHLAIADISLSFSSDYNSDSLYSVWNTIQWSYFIYDFGPGLLVQAYQFSAHPSQLFSFWRAATREFWFYGITIGIIFLLGIFTIILGKVFTYTTFLGCVLTVKNSFVTVYFVIVFSFGLQELPRQIMYAASPVMMLNNLKYDALKQKEYIQVLQHKYLHYQPQLEQIENEIERRIQLYNKSITYSKVYNLLIKTKQYIEYIKLITQMTVNKLKTMKSGRIVTNQNTPSSKLVQISTQNDSVQLPIKNEQVINLQSKSNYRLNVIIENIMNEYKYICFRVEREYQIMNNIIKKFEKYQILRKYQKYIQSEENYINPFKIYFYNHIRPFMYIILLIIVFVLSLIIIISNFMIIKPSWSKYSVILILMNYAKQHNQLPITVILYYYINFIFLFYGLNTSRMGITFKICNQKGTDCKSTVFYSNRLTTLLFVLSWNLSQILGISQDTAFFKGVGQLQRVPIFGIQLMTYLPIIIFAVYIMWAFKIQRVVRAIFSKKSVGINQFQSLKDLHMTEAECIIQQFKNENNFDNSEDNLPVHTVNDIVKVNFSNIFNKISNNSLEFGAWNQ